MKRFYFLVCLVLLGLAVEAQKHPPKVKPADPPKPYGPVPTAAQVAWQRMEMNMFCHFGPNTFTGLEWGEGTEAEDIFIPVCSTRPRGTSYHPTRMLYRTEYR